MQKKSSERNRMMKILYVTTIGSTMNFFKSYIKLLLEKGYQVDIATNEENSKIAECYYEWGCKIYQISSSRSPLNIGNVKAIKQIKDLVENKKYDIVHCHTPIAAMCTRIACCKARKNGTKVFYTAHGFHFYKGAPLKNWILYYPIEKVCAHFTDVLITINQEDFILAKKKMKAKKVELVNGVGIDIDKFEKIDIDRMMLRQEYGISNTDILLLSIGELNENKNHETVIRAIADMDIHYMIVGKGKLQEHLQSVIDELGISNKVILLGYRNDIAELCQMADVFVFPSYREGLPVSIMEAMASALPVVCSEIRGNIDLVDENGGVWFNPYSVEECRKAILSVISNDLEKMKKYNKAKIQKFSDLSINSHMLKIYTTN